MPSQIIQWFPGHMAKTRRLITENLADVDLVLELLDARIPLSSKNPEIERLCGTKPKITLLNKASLADPAASAAWAAKYRSETTRVLLCDCITGEGLGQLMPAVRELLADKLERYAQKGMQGRRLKAMVVGIPNVGKSSLINRLAGRSRAKVENRPGVTRDKQWVTTTIGLDLLDMPGVLWPKFDDTAVGENLALTGAIKDDILDIETLGVLLCRRLRALYPDQLCARYKLTPADLERCPEASDLFLAIGRKRGFLISGGEIDTERTANMLLDEFRAAKIGRITLDRPAAQKEE
ncbi:MAG: ribosome biogenesis GTPase YlqF [Ruminococcaceae bacterium]|nr:ribosome biogenesis GTPase YlqF [Oscillospiraceae bacterium]